MRSASVSPRFVSRCRSSAAQRTPVHRLGCSTLWSTRHGENSIGSSCRSSHGMYIYPCVGLGVGAEVHWRRFTYGSRTVRHGAVIHREEALLWIFETRLSPSSEHAPSIIFMDEIDSIGSTRVEGSSGGDSEVQRTMLELLNQLDRKSVV